jgi:hypothetical protein
LSSLKIYSVFGVILRIVAFVALENAIGGYLIPVESELGLAFDICAGKEEFIRLASRLSSFSSKDDFSGVYPLIHFQLGACLEPQQFRSWSFWNFGVYDTITHRHED